jgi:hypothetical protein
LLSRAAALITVEPGSPWAPTLRSPTSDRVALTVIVAITLVGCLRAQQQHEECPIASPFVGAFAEPPLTTGAPHLARPP